MAVLLVQFTRLRRRLDNHSEPRNPQRSHGVG
jgi:hypothetical protein